MKRIFSFICLLILTGCNQQKGSDGRFALSEFNNVEPIAVIEAEKYEIPVYDFNRFEKIWEEKNDKIYVVNFWATWCKPCVKELPAFEKLYRKYKRDDVEVILVSLDFPKKVDEVLVPFLEEKDFKRNVMLLDDPKQNTWIPKVDANWSGAIPATIIFNKNKRLFYEKSFTFKELEKELQGFLN
ncbi:TlpA family protein disulfide reductase [Galbibacter sp. BG1]|uniref:TlpA disulfide reductase family protein n=1 Tax=Galbibacter sp. BG1 TaxID=1170699 RepID=UPI0015B9E5D9|nr:TlpA disulfide reductase family protein [Galbibacter sp. BG1]QLE01670.1 TlpA family protein disulfide reductase [Galbibacter sp. BG1]